MKFRIKKEKRENLDIYHGAIFTTGKNMSNKYTIFKYSSKKEVADNLNIDIDQKNGLYSIRTSDLIHVSFWTKQELDEKFETGWIIKDYTYDKEN